MKLLRALVCCLFAAVPLWSQSLPADELRVRIRQYSPPTQPRIRVGTDLVLLRVVVRDKSGKVVSGLQQGDFEVRDRGRLYVMSVFSEEALGAPAKAVPSLRRANEPKQPLAESAGPEPRYVAIFMDDANLPLSDLVPARDAAVSFVKNNLKPGDQVGLFTYSLQQIQDFTEDTSKILAQLAEVRSQHRRADDGPGACPWIGVQQAYQIVQQRDIEALNLAVEQALVCPAFYTMGPVQNRNDVMITVTRQADVVFSMAEQFSHRTMGSISRTVDYLGRMPGKRVLLLASSGFWTRSLKREQDRVIERAIRREITINSLDAKGLATRGVDYSQGAAPVLINNPHLQYAADRFMRDQMESYNDPLSMLAQGTGGQFFHNNNNLTAGLATLAEPPEVSYLMAFEPENLLADGSFHRLTVKMPKPNTFSISTRPGYYAPTKQEQEKRAKEDPFDDVMQSQTTFEEIPMQVSTQMGQSPLGGPTLHVTVRVDVKKIPFQKRDERHRQRLRYATAVFARDGTFLAGSQALFELSLKDETLAKLSAEGLEQKWTIDIPPGSFYVRQVVQEALEGGIAASTHALEIKRQTACAQPTIKP